ncbi:MAG: acyl-CoA dehydrogenase family protein [Archaeoglobaceae archaeon]|nr:acyl-CoA dehydrogenase family protein [Archaeoglobaceae archaeon]MDW8128351.1 acyl-CoA dehydrogenase family protein [Archaeoglobaceae archaeon]
MLSEFILTEEQKAIKDAAREFAEKEFPKYAEECDREEKFPFELWKKAAELGFIGMSIPEEYGGQGAGILDSCLVVEEFWRVDGGLGQILSSPFGSEQIQMFGTEEQKKKYLPPIAKGKAICCACYTEPQAGSDVAGIKTRADKVGNEYVINGTKMFITNGTIADYYVVLARTDPNPPKRHHGMSVFLVEKGTPGLEAKKLHNKLGIRASDTAEVVFKNVRVPKENMIGQEGQGFYQTMMFFNVTRIPVAFQAVGLAQGAFDLAFNYAKNRELFEQKLIDFQITQDKLAKMRVMLEAARLLAYQAAYFQDKMGMPDPGLTAMAKYYCGHAACEIVNEALQIHGGYGYMGEQAISRMYRDVRILEIYEGTREVELEIIARSLLGRVPSKLSQIRKHPLM